MLITDITSAWLSVWMLSWRSHQLMTSLSVKTESCPSQQLCLKPVLEVEIRRGVDDLDEILRPIGFKTSLVVIRRANSLALYFICMTSLAMMSLCDQWHVMLIPDKRGYKKQRYKHTMKNNPRLLSL